MLITLLVTGWFINTTSWAVAAAELDVQPVSTRSLTSSVVPSVRSRSGDAVLVGVAPFTPACTAT